MNRPRMGKNPLNSKNNLDWREPTESKTKKNEVTSKSGLEPEWTRATFIMKEEYSKKIKAVSYWERKSIKEVVDEIMGSYFKDKKVKSKPEKSR